MENNILECDLMIRKIIGDNSWTYIKQLSQFVDLILFLSFIHHFNSKKAYIFSCNKLKH